MDSSLLRARYSGVALVDTIAGNHEKFVARLGAIYSCP